MMVFMPWQVRYMQTRGWRLKAQLLSRQPRSPVSQISLTLDSQWCNPFFICCIPVFLIVSLVSIIKGILNRRCPKCRKIKLVIKETVIREASYTSSGEKLVERTCSYCGYYDKKLVTIPKKTRSSGGGFIGGFGGGGGGGGGGGFGGGSSGGGGASGGW